MRRSRHHKQTEPNTEGTEYTESGEMAARPSSRFGAAEECKSKDPPLQKAQGWGTRKLNGRPTRPRRAALV